MRVVALISEAFGGFGGIALYNRDLLILAWTGFPRRRLHVLPNAIRLERYGAGDKTGHLLQRYGLAGTRVIMTLGRLSAAERYKGIDEVLELLPGPGGRAARPALSDRWGGR